MTVRREAAPGTRSYTERRGSTGTPYPVPVGACELPPDCFLVCAAPPLPSVAQDVDLEVGAGGSEHDLSLSTSELDSGPLLLLHSLRSTSKLVLDLGARSQHLGARPAAASSLPSFNGG
eukprot:3285141-Rhodomonas_salina.2